MDGTAEASSLWTKGSTLIKCKTYYLFDVSSYVSLLEGLLAFWQFVLFPGVRN